MRKNDIQVAALQKIFLNENYPLCNPPDNTMITQNRPTETGKGGGMFHCTQHGARRIIELKCPNPDNHIEQQAIDIVKGRNNNIKLVNVYLPPQSSCATGYFATLNYLLPLTDTLTVGDVNGHSQLWHCNLNEDPKGQLLSVEVDESHFLVLTEEKPKRVTKTTRSSTSISLAHSNLAMNMDLAAEKALSSDHRLITQRLTCDITTITTP